MSFAFVHKQLYSKRHTVYLCIVCTYLLSINDIIYAYLVWNNFDLEYNKMRSLIAQGVRSGRDSVRTT